MSATALDTFQVVKKLKAGGFSEEQAEPVTQMVRDSQNLDLSNLVRKADLSEVRSELKAEIAGLRSDTKAKFAGVRSEFRTECAKFRTEIADTKVEIIKWVTVPFRASLRASGVSVRYAAVHALTVSNAALTRGHTPINPCAKSSKQERTAWNSR